MTRLMGFAPCLVAFVLTTTAFAQNGTSSSSGTPADSAAAATTGDDAAAGTSQVSVKQLLKSEWTQLVIAAIHGLFQEIRPALGLPATPADPTSDPLSLLESAIVTALTASASASSSTSASQ